MKHAILFVLAIFMFQISGCSENGTGPLLDPDDFTIHVSKNTELEMINIENIELEDEPLINSADIESYTWPTHEIRLKEETFNRINSSQPKLYRKIFVVSVRSLKIYAGYFWSQISSSICVNPVINISPAGTGKDYDLISRDFKIERAYPAGNYSDTKTDPRNDERIKNVLIQNRLISGIED